MSSIDERVVQMQFENSQFEKGIKETVKSLGLLKKELNVDKASESLEHLQSVGDSFSLSKISNQLEKIVERTSWFGRTIRREIDSITAQAINLGKSLSVGQVSAGWSKYEQKTASVQTIINATGKSIDEVNGYLDKLMWFSDETSYNFTEMTAALGTLTSSGGDIDKMIPMIEGMATATAFAGKTAAEFSRVIYNLNQSYSQGYLSLMDWKSVELAQVGSEQLKQTLIDTAVELGTLKKLSDGTFKTKKGTIVNAGNMGSTLNEKWATKEVMEGAFGKFSQVIEEAYKLVEAGEFDTAADAIASLAGKYDETYYKAAKAAQEAKSFKEAVDATADAVSSGWMKTFELIFGNYEEARVLWTDLANALWEVFASGADQRNETLEAWKEAGGRTDLIEGITDALSALWTIITTVKDAFRDIFPKATSDDLLKISSKVKELGKQFKELAHVMEITAATRRELVTETTPLEEYFGDLEKGVKGDAVKKLQQALIDKGFDVGKHGVDGIFGKDTEAALKAFQESIGETADGIYKEGEHAKLVGTITQSKFQSVFETIKKYTPFLDSIKRIATGAFSVLKILGEGILFVGKVAGKVISLLAPFVDVFLTIFASLGDGATAVGEWMDEVKPFDKWLERIDALLNPVRITFEKAADSIKKFFGFDPKTGKKLKGISQFSETMAKVKTFLQPVLDWFSTAYDKIKKFFGIGTEMYENGELVPDRGPSQFVQTLLKVKEFLQPVLDWFSTAFDTVKEKLKDIFSPKETEGLDEGTEKVSFFATALEKVKAILQPVIDWFPVAFEKIKHFFGIGREVYENGELVPDRSPSPLVQMLLKVKAFLQPVLDWFPTAYENIKKFFGIGQEVYENGGLVPSKFSVIFQKVKNAVKSVIDWFKTAFEGGTIGESLKNFWESLKKIFGHNEGEIGFGNILSKIGNAFSGIVKFIVDNKGIILLGVATYALVIAPIKKLLDYVKGMMDTWNAFKNKTSGDDKGKKANSIGKTIQQIGIGIALIAASLFIIGKMKPEELKRSIWSIIGLIGTLIGFSVIANKLGGNAKAISTAAYSIEKIGKAMAIIAGVVVILGMIKTNHLVKGTLTLTTLMGLLLGFIALYKVINKTDSAVKVDVSVKGFMAMAVGIMILASAVKMLGKMSLWEIVKGTACVAALSALIYALILLSSQCKLSKMSGLLVIAGTITILSLIVITLGNMGSERLKQGMRAVGQLGLLIAAMMLVFAAANLIGVVGMSKGAAAIGAAFVVLSTIVIAFFSFIGLLNAHGAIEKMINSAAGVMKAIGRAFGSVIGGFIEAIGDGLSAIRTGITGMSDNKHLDKDLEASFTVVEKVFAFLNDFANARETYGWSSDTNRRLGLILQNIEQFGNAIGAVGVAINGLSKSNYEADTDAAVKVMDAIAEALIGLQEFGNENSWEKKVTGGIASWWKTTETMINQILDDIAKFGTVVQTVREAVSGLSETKKGHDDPTIVEDTNVATQIIGQVTDALSGLGDLANSKTWLKPRLFLKVWLWGENQEIDNLLLLCSKFGEAASKIKEGVAGLADGKMYTGEDGEKHYAIEKDVNVATAIVTQVTNALEGLGDLAEGKTWFKPKIAIAKWFTGYNTQLDPILETIGHFGEVTQKVRDAVYGISDAKTSGTDANGNKYTYKALEDTDVATTVVDKIVEYLEELTSNVALKAYADDKEFDNWIIDTQSAANFVVSRLEEFTPAMKDILSTIAELNLDTAEADAETAVSAVGVVVEFLSGIQDYDLEKSKGALDRFFNGDTATDTMISRLGTFGEQIGTMFQRFSGFSESTIEADSQTAFSILRAFTNLVTWIGTDERSGDIFSNLAIVDRMSNLLTGLGASIVDLSDDLKGADLSTIEKITKFLTSLDGMLSGIKGVEEVSKLFNDLKSLFTGENEGEIPSWLNGLSSDQASSKISDFVGNFVSSATTEFSKLNQEFVDIGKNMGDGIVKGLEGKRAKIVAKMIELIRAGISAGNKEAEINSPSKKTEKMGHFLGLGLVKGIDGSSSLVDKSFTTMSKDVLGKSNGIFAELSNALSQDMDFDPVVRPIVDLSDVMSSSKRMNGLLSANRSIELAGAATISAARFKADKESKSTTAGAVNANGTNVEDSTAVNLTGNNFYIRSEQDVKSLASEIATLTKQQQRSLGAAY